MIKKAQPSDIRTAAQLVQILHIRHPLEEVEQELESWLDQEDRVLFLALNRERTVGVALCSLKTNDVEGASFYPAACLEGLYVIEEERGKGYGTQLLTQCEEWAREHKCLQLASQCSLSNTESLVFFLKNHLEEASRTIHLIKSL